MQTNFTKRVLQNAVDKIPNTPNNNTQWWADREIDERVLYNWIISRHEAINKLGLSFDVRAWVLVGMMVGFEIGRMSVDPSYALAAELDRG